MKFKVKWSNNAKNDLRKLDTIISNAKLDAIYNAPEQIVFPSNFKLMNTEKIAEE